MKKIIIAGLFLSALLAGIIITIIVRESSRDIAPVASVQDTPVPSQNELTAEPAPEERLTYTNATVGLSFTYPRAYTVRERERLNESFAAGDSYQGNWVYITVEDEQKDVVLSVTAVSNDFMQNEGEGCCYVFKKMLDLDQDIALTTSIISSVLRDVTDVSLRDIGGKDSVEFFYTTAYVSTVLHRGAITPLNTDMFANALFSSGVLKETKGPSELELDAAILASGGTPSPGEEINREAREAAFEDILRTVTWIQ